MLADRARISTSELSRRSGLLFAEKEMESARSIKEIVTTAEVAASNGANNSG